jgi:hypothetical protein
VHPAGRDQFFNAERVHDLRAGRMLMPDVDVDVDSDAIALATKISPATAASPQRPSTWPTR